MNGTFPMELVAKMAAMGLYGASLKGYECAGLGAVAYGLIMQELERGDSGLRSFVSVQGALCMYPIYAYGSDAQKNRWLPAMARGEKIGCFGLTEPDFGSNPGGMLTKAEKRDGGFVLNGNKMWITNGGIADIAIVWARTEEGIRGFLVERGTRGYTTTDTHGKWSLRASVTSELHFQDCFVPAEAMLPGVLGLKGPLSCLTQARYGIAWGGVGAAQACLDEALRYSKTRIQFDKPIASFQLVQQKLAWMATEITKAQGLALRVGRLKEAGEATPAQVSMAKMNNVKVALDSARLTRDILGANGITNEYQCFRHMVNLESVITYEGTHDIHALIIGNELTGIPAFA
jgi:glutaryl-CoA dehydrogenase